MTLSLHHLTCTFGKTRALDEVSASIDTPALLGLTGPNGAGKSTLLRVLGARQLPTSGRAEICGVDTTDPRARALLAFVPETPSLPPEMTPLEYLSWLARARRCEMPQGWLERTGLSELSARLGALSTGQRRRVALAGALLPAPPIVLLDEPFSGLDTSERDLWCALLQEQAQRSIVLLSSHEHDMLDRLTPRRWEMTRGRLCEVTR